MLLNLRNWIFKKIPGKTPSLSLRSFFEPTVVAERAKPLEQVQGLRVVGDEHHLVVGLSLDVGQQAVEHRELARESGLQTPFRVVILWKREKIKNAVRAKAKANEPEGSAAWRSQSPPSSPCNARGSGPGG